MCSMISMLLNMNTLWKYVRHWFGYCYYRCVNQFSKSSREPEYFYGSIPFCAFICPIAAVLIKSVSYVPVQYWETLFMTIISIIVLPLFCNKKKYNQMNEMFNDEGGLQRKLLGFLVYTTFIIPVVIAIIFLCIR